MLGLVILYQIQYIFWYPVTYGQSVIGYGQYGGLMDTIHCTVYNVYYFVEPGRTSGENESHMVAIQEFAISGIYSGISSEPGVTW